MKKEMPNPEEIFYLLSKKGKPYSVPTIGWALNWEKNRIIKQTKIGEFFVSTVFLGINHNFIRGYPLILFETMVFVNGESLLEYEKRYRTLIQSKKGHTRTIKRIRRLIKNA